MEKAIKEKPGDAEIHFLRLTIQYNTPPILKYNKNIKKDLEVVLSSFGKINLAILRKNMKEFLFSSDLLTDTQRNKLKKS